LRGKPIRAPVAIGAKVDNLTQLGSRKLSGASPRDAGLQAEARRYYFDKFYKLY